MGFSGPVCQRDGVVHFTAPPPPPDCIGTEAGAVAGALDPCPTATPGADCGEEELVDAGAVWPGGTSFGASAQAEKSRENENRIAVVRQLPGAKLNFIKKTP